MYSLRYRLARWVLGHRGLAWTVFIAVTAFLLTIPMIHWILPRFAADFQTENFGASMMLSAMIGLGTLMGASITGQTTGFFPEDAFVMPDAPEDMPLQAEP